MRSRSAAIGEGVKLFLGSARIWKRGHERQQSAKKRKSFVVAAGAEKRTFLSIFENQDVEVRVGSPPTSISVSPVEWVVLDIE